MTKDITIGIDDQLYEGTHSLSGVELRKIVEEAIRKRMGESPAERQEKLKVAASETKDQEEWNTYLAQYRSQTNREEAMKAVSGLWKGRGIDSIEYQRNMRAEWDSNG